MLNRCVEMEGDCIAVWYWGAADARLRRIFRKEFDALIFALMVTLYYLNSSLLLSNTFIM